MKKKKTLIQILPSILIITLAFLGTSNVNSYNPCILSSSVGENAINIESELRCVQNRLSELSYTDNGEELIINGIIDTKTINAIKLFQANIFDDTNLINGLIESGDDTNDWLNSEYAPRYSGNPQEENNGEETTGTNEEDNAEDSDNAQGESDNEGNEDQYSEEYSSDGIVEFVVSINGEATETWIDINGETRSGSISKNQDIFGSLSSDEFPKNIGLFSIDFRPNNGGTISDRRFTLLSDNPELSFIFSDTNEKTTYSIQSSIIANISSVPNNLDLWRQGETSNGQTRTRLRIKKGTSSVLTPSSINFGRVKVSSSKQDIDIVLQAPNYFGIEDLSGRGGYYTTLQISELRDGDKILELNEARVRIENGVIHTIGGKENSGVSVPYGVRDFISFDAESPAVILEKDNSSKSIGKYGVLPDIKLTIAPYQQVGDYRGTITFTIIEE